VGATVREQTPQKKTASHALDYGTSFNLFLVGVPAAPQTRVHNLGTRKQSWQRVDPDGTKWSVLRLDLVNAAANSFVRQRSLSIAV